LALIALFSIIIIGVSGQRQNSHQKNNTAANDTVPKNKKVQNLDDVIDNLDRAELELNMEKMKKGIEDAMKNINADKRKMEIEKEKDNAKTENEKAKKEMQEYKDFVDGLEKDGLINKKEYTIEKKNGELFINGKKQPAEVYNKYRSFLDKQKDFKIEKSEGNFNINNKGDR